MTVERGIPSKQSKGEAAALPHYRSTCDCRLCRPAPLGSLDGVMDGWHAKRGQHPELGGMWSIYPPSGNNVCITDDEKSSGSAMLRELAQSLVDKATAGTFACPICGHNQPHRHSGAEIAEYSIAAAPSAPEGGEVKS